MANSNNNECHDARLKHCEMRAKMCKIKTGLYIVGQNC